MKQYLSNLSPSVLQPLRLAATKSTSLQVFEEQPTPQSLLFIENAHNCVVNLNEEMVADGLIMGKIVLKGTALKITARLRGLSFIEQPQTKPNSKCAPPLPQFPQFLRDANYRCTSSQTFLQDQCDIQWQETLSCLEGLFEFALDSSMPNSIRMLADGVRRSVIYILELRCQGLTYLRTVEVKWPKEQKMLESEISYAVVDFQRTLFCCFNYGIFRIEAIYPQSHYSRGSMMLGRINYFRQTKGQLILFKLRIDLYARIKWRTPSTEMTPTFILISTKSIYLQQQPEYGLKTAQYCLLLPDQLPESTRNILYTITYFTLLTPISDDYTLSILEDNIREIGISAYQSQPSQTITINPNAKKPSKLE